MIRNSEILGNEDGYAEYSSVKPFIYRASGVFAGISGEGFCRRTEPPRLFANLRNREKISDVCV